MLMLPGEEIKPPLGGELKNLTGAGASFHLEEVTFIFPPATSCLP